MYIYLMIENKSGFNNDSVTLFNTKNEAFKKASKLYYNVNIYEAPKEEFKALERSFKKSFVSNSKLSAFHRLLFQNKIKMIN